MNPRLVITTILSFAIACPLVVVSADEEPLPSRAARYRIRPIEMHEVHIQAAPPGRAEERELRFRGQPDHRRLDETPMAPSAHYNTFMIPTPAQREESSRRNWILPPFSAEREEREPSGWGWLADEIIQRRLAAEAEQRIQWEREEAESRELQWLMNRRNAETDSRFLEHLLFREATLPTPGEPATEAPPTLNVFEGAELRDERILNRAAVGSPELDPRYAIANQGFVSDTAEDEILYGDRWGMMDRIWGYSDQESRSEAQYEPPVRSMIPSFEDNLRASDLFPDSGIIREQIDAAGSPLPGPGVTEVPATASPAESEIEFGAFSPGFTQPLQQDTWHAQTVDFGREETSFQPPVLQRPAVETERQRSFPDW